MTDKTPAPIMLSLSSEDFKALADGGTCTPMLLTGPLHLQAGDFSPQALASLAARETIDYASADGRTFRLRARVRSPLWAGVGE